MQSHAHVAVVVASLAASSLPAAADWQYTRWGMSTSDLAAVPIVLNKPSPDERVLSRLPGLGEPEWRSPYSAGEFKFTAYYLFQSDKLRAVSLHGDPKDAAAIITSLRSQYGPTSREYSSRGSCPVYLLEWVGLGHANDVRLVTTNCYESKQHSVVVTYMMPRLNPGL